MTVIETERLRLVCLSPELIASTAHENRPLSEQLIGRPLPEDWFDDAWVFAQRQQQIVATPEFADWAAWAIVTKANDKVIGCLNCHHLPMPFQLEGQIHLATEIGYYISPPFRRQGYAREAVQAFHHWAKNFDVKWLLITIAPNNLPSLSLGQSLNARFLGEQPDGDHAPQRIFYLS